MLTAQGALNKANELLAYDVGTPEYRQANIARATAYIALARERRLQGD